MSNYSVYILFKGKKVNWNQIELHSCLFPRFLHNKPAFHNCPILATWCWWERYDTILTCITLWGIALNCVWAWHNAHLYTIYKLYGNGLIPYIIDRLWMAGLLCKNGWKYPAVYTGSLISKLRKPSGKPRNVSKLLRADSLYSTVDESSDELKLCPTRKKQTCEHFFFIFSSDMACLVLSFFFGPSDIQLSANLLYYMDNRLNLREKAFKSRENSLFMLSCGCSYVPLFYFIFDMRGRFKIKCNLTKVLSYLHEFVHVILDLHAD